MPCSAFEIKGGVDAGRAFVEALELHSHVANIGDVRSLVIHPGVDDALAADARRSRRPPASRPASSASPSGIENINDILADLDAGFRAAKQA